MAPHQTRPSGVRCRARFDATVEFKRELCSEHFLLRLRLAESFPATKPGQFVQLGCRAPADRGAAQLPELQWKASKVLNPTDRDLCGPLALLRRPFSLAGRGEAGDETWIDIIGRVVGVGTRWLSELEQGDSVDLIGPLGNWFDRPEDRCLALLVGGGVGLPPMFYLAEALKAAGWEAVAFVGARRRDLLAVTFNEETPPNREGLPTLCVAEFARFDYPTVITTDDGSCGLHGQITNSLELILKGLSGSMIPKAIVYTCGPEPMMQGAAKLAERYGVACQVCLEQSMACGMGTCQSCVVRIDPGRQQPHGLTRDGRSWRYRLACSDGPVFDSKVVVW